MIEQTGHIDPCWEVEDYVDLKYNQDTVDDSYLKIFLDAGHNKDQMCLFNYFEPNVMPYSVKYIKDNFKNLKNLTAAVNLILPGQYMPLHSDLYLRWKSVHNISEINNIVRIIVMLEDSSPGQILQIGSSVFSNWQAGDWFSWYGDKIHAVYNFSLKNRYAIQLTGLDTNPDQNQIPNRLQNIHLQTT